MKLQQLMQYLRQPASSSNAHHILKTSQSIGTLHSNQHSPEKNKPSIKLSAFNQSAQHSFCEQNTLLGTFQAVSRASALPEVTESLENIYLYQMTPSNYCHKNSSDELFQTQIIQAEDQIYSLFQILRQRVQKLQQENLQLQQMCLDQQKMYIKTQKYAQILEDQVEELRYYMKFRQ